MWDFSECVIVIVIVIVRTRADESSAGLEAEAALHTFHILDEVQDSAAEQRHPQNKDDNMLGRVRWCRSAACKRWDSPEKVLAHPRSVHSVMC